MRIRATVNGQRVELPEGRLPASGMTRIRWDGRTNRMGTGATVYLPALIMRAMGMDPHWFTNFEARVNVKQGTIFIKFKRSDP